MPTTERLSENSHQGFEGIKAALCLAEIDPNPNPASGMAACLRPQGTESRCSGKERDAESGLDYFRARYYSGAQGRYMIPDWSLKASPVPYANFKNPQSLNLYSYVGHNPLTRRDANGHCWPISQCIQELSKKIDSLVSKAETKAVSTGNPAL